MANRPARRSRRLRGLSPTSLEPSSRRRRRNIASGFQPMTASASEIDPPVGVIDSQDRPGISRESGRNTLVLSRVLFQSEDNIEVKDIIESVVTPNSPLPPHHSDFLLYVVTTTKRPSSPGLH